MAQVTAAAIVGEARQWLSTRFRHQGRGPEGVDCAGLVICVARRLGLVQADFDVNGYGRRPDGKSLLEACELHLTRVQAYVRPGDICVFRIATDPQHLAIAADYYAGGLSIVHAYAPNHCVVENRFDTTWLRRLVAAYRFPEAA